MVDYSSQEPEEGGQNLTHVRRIIDDLKERQVTQHNVKKVLPGINNTLSVIESQIENHQLQLRKATKKHNDEMERVGEERLRSMDNDGIAPATLYDAMKDISHHTREMFAWQTINNELQYLLNRKLISALSNLSDYEVESRVSEQVSDLHKQMMNQTQDLVTNLIQQQNQKIDMIQEASKERADLLMQKNLSQLRDIQKSQNESMRLLVDYVLEVFRQSASSGGGGVDAEVLERLVTRKFRDLAKSQEEALERSMASEEVPVPVREKYAPVKELPKDASSARGFSGSSEEGDNPAVASGGECPHCGESFRDKLQLETHIEFAHEGEE